MFMSGMMKQMFYRNPLTMLGALLCKKGLNGIRKTMDYRETGGSIVIGISRPVIKAHGSSDDAAIRGAIRQASRAVESGFCEEIRANIGQMILPNIDNGPEPTTSTYERVLDVLEEKSIPTTCASPEDTYSLGNGCITILGDGVKTDNLNNTSTALRFDANGLSLVATGDGEKEVEKQLLAAKKKELQADVYKAAHHGSSTSNTLEFLQAVSPQVVVVSCGKDNSYGHPHKEAMQNFAAVGAQVLRTDELGSIAVWEQEGEVHYACTAGKDAA